MRSRALDDSLLSSHGIGDNHFSLLSFYDKDHGEGNANSIEWLDSILKNSHITDVDGEVWLHTFPRVFGFVFNPVSFWFCHHSSGDLRAIIAEVNNTFGERHCYLIANENGSPLHWGQEHTAPKSFHVSPFFDVKGHYLFRFMRQQSNGTKPRSVSRIEYFEDEKLSLITSISGQEYPLSFQIKYKALLLYPLLTFGIAFKIHWQALKLWIKGAKFRKKPAPPTVKIT
jgi:DUF1365 family protein